MDSDGDTGGLHVAATLPRLYSASGQQPGPREILRAIESPGSFAYNDPFKHWTLLLRPEALADAQHGLGQAVWKVLFL